MGRLSTGNVRLDEVLGGGLMSDAITLVVGAPGTGKTILAEQCLFANATPEPPGLYLSTVSEPFDKLLRYGQSLDFFDTAQLGRSVFYDDLGDALHEHGLPAVLERLDTLIKAHHPGIVVIDSFKALRTFATSDAEFRRFLHDLAGRLTAWPFRRCGSASTSLTRRPARPSSPSPTPSSVSRCDDRRSDRFATSASASCAAATSCPATTCIASPPADWSSSRAWPTCATPLPTRRTVTESRAASPHSTTRSRTATGPVRPHSSPDHPAPGRASWACTSSSPAQPRTSRACSSRCRRTGRNSPASSAVSGGPSTTPT